MLRIDDMGIVRLEGDLRLDRAVRVASDGIRMAREQGLRKLMIATLDLRVPGPVTLTDRLAMVREWADAAQGRVCLAVVARPELIDAERFGVVVAAGLGLVANVFTREDEALAWLGQQP